MAPWLSVLVPSKRPEGLERFVSSLRQLADRSDDIEVVVLVDTDEVEHDEDVELRDRVLLLRKKRHSTVNMSWLNEQCYLASTGAWIMLGNDDIVVETPGWDTKIRTRVEQWPDGVVLAWPDDGLFGGKLACFPIVSRRLLDEINFWPQPYGRYLIDNTLHEVIPSARHAYVEDVMMRHFNVAQVRDGRHYAVDNIAACHDLALWPSQSNRRTLMRAEIDRMMAYHYQTGGFVSGRRTS